MAKARFFKHSETHDDGSVHELEMIGIAVNDGQDEAVRVATDEDRMLYGAAFLEYREAQAEAEKAAAAEAHLGAARAEVAVADHPAEPAPAASGTASG